MDSSFPQNEILIVITIGIIVMLVFAMAFVLFFYFSQKKFQSERLSAQEREMEHQAQLLFGSIQTQENERERIARELHDEVGSKLNVINLGLHRLRKSVDAKAISELFSILNTTIETTRQISHDLLPPTLASFGLPTALEELCENHRKSSEVKVNFKLYQNDFPVNDRDVALHLFRIIQELMSNSFKYSEASKIEVSLWMGKEKIRMAYQENGKGFEVNASVHQMGLGMQNIESRTRMIDAKYQIKSSEGEGVFFELIKDRT